MSSGALALLISLSIGQTDGVPVLDEVFQSSSDRPPPPGERKIRVIQHPDRDFKLAGALRLRIGVDAAILSAEYETDTLGTPRSAFELGDDLGFDPVALALKSEVEFRPFKMLHLRVGGSWVEWDGDERLESDLRFGRVDFPAGTNTATDFRLLETHVYLGHELGRWSRGHHGYLIGARYFQTELHVKSDGRSERNRIEGAMPVIGYSGGLSPFDGLELRAQIS
ncbi:MAG: hypothetical protein O6952_03065, partial [Planctomycetota bacterium]|nr:hypothetical protein [Planctomycetota bacterium]